jgi:protein-L-isoaspartate(D-aspartate) O-methyltransferase
MLRIAYHAAGLCLTLFAAWFPHAVVADDFASQRAAMLRAIEGDSAVTRQYLDRERLDARVMAAMGRVARHALVPDRQRKSAYENRPLPIGYGQTISQPYVVALMTDLLQPQPGDRVLEIGTGSGYQAAVLAELVARVYTIEVIAPLGERARDALQALGYRNIEVRIGDGYYGWAQHAPYDAIVVTAAASHVPPPLLKQLKPGGRLVIPVGSAFQVQQLVLVQKAADGAISTRQILPVSFVPLTGDHD